MLAHKFGIGQMVECLPSANDVHVPPGPYIVQRCLPSDTGNLQYRLKHTKDGHERVLLESQLRADKAVSGAER
jgi:hypothetical protein